MKHIVIIPIFNELKSTEEMLRSYVCNTYFGSCETFLVDDGSNQSTKKELEKIISQNPDLSLICNSRNIGKPKSVNKIIFQNKNVDYFTIKEKEIKIYKRRSEYIMKTHDVYYSTFKNFKQKI